MLIIRNIRLDLEDPGQQGALYMRRGEKNTYSLHVSVMKGGESVAPYGVAATLHAVKPDGTEVLQTGLVLADGTMVIPVPAQMLAAEGVVVCTVLIAGENGETVEAPSFHVYVEAGEETGAVSTSDYQALMDALALVQELNGTIRRRVSVRVLGHVYETAEDLAEDITQPTAGDIYLVGASLPYNMYRWTGEEWENDGPLSGNVQDKISEDRIYNGLDQTLHGYVLDARQGAAIAGKLDADRVYNGLDMEDEGYALDARQGAEIENKLNKDSVYNDLDQEDEGFALDARQGKELMDAINTKAGSEELDELEQAVGGKAAMQTAVVTLTAAGWNANAGGETTTYEQTVQTAVAHANNVILAAPASSAWAEYGECCVRCTGQSEGSLTFTADEAAQNSLQVNILALS